MSAATAIVGVDLGGTKADIRVLVDGRTVAAERIASDADEGAARVIDRICDKVLELTEGHEVAALGLAIPGVVEADRVRLAPNIPGLEDVSIAELVNARIPGVRLRVLNDLNAAAYGLHNDGASSVMTVGLGTGIAASLCVNGRVVEGAFLSAGEIGDAHVPTPSSGEFAPLERLAGGKAFDDLAHEHQLANAKAVLDAVADGACPVELAAEVEQRLRLLAGAVAVATRMADPHELVLFGGLALHPTVRRYIDEALAPHRASGLRVRWMDADENPVLGGAVKAAQSVILDDDNASLIVA